MELRSLIETLDIGPVPERALGVRISDLTDDSRTVLPGSLFVARSGVRDDGRKYIEQAVRDGAVAVLTDEEGAKLVDEKHALVLIASDVALAAAQMAERFNGNPTEKLKLVGVTGTNGKTTVVHLVHGIMNAAGVRTGMIGTVEIDDGREIAQAEMTTPPAIELSRTFANMVDAGCKAAVMEASSHALDQRRVAGLAFDIGVFTTLGTDHMDYHADRDAYLKAKQRLFGLLKEDGVAIVNADDPACEEMITGCKARIVRTSMEKGDWTARVLARQIDGVRVRIEGPLGAIEVSLPLMGDHNAMNLLQAVAVAHELGVDSESIVAALAHPELPRGRLQRVPGTGDVSVFVDFAHTPDALERTLHEMRRSMQESGHRGNLWIVFGCGGNKDKTKRPVMGKIAGELADRIVITSDNPRTEAPEAIVREVFEGVEPARRTDVAQIP
ncbi:MAG: UDP-N-acetylmuramoyl-L-alanyl-D-glutamate--2,6-diaminopimelate ligase, partial [Phycisphaerales bacterium]|nr:UDP-N-acetylmuramoyl-L-alanyl-D-glutamate--2,6-diaminopimelate ligase [Phycisphaerales bacterium]